MHFLAIYVKERLPFTNMHFLAIYVKERLPFTNMHFLAIYLKERLRFTRDISLENSEYFYLCFQITVFCLVSYVFPLFSLSITIFVFVHCL